MTQVVHAPDRDSVPDELEERNQWLLWDASHDTPRRPHWNGDFSVSWSDPDTWHSFDEALRVAETVDSWGIGYVMALDNPDHPGGQYACIDIDGGLDENAHRKDWVPDISRFIESGAYIERSPSGRGLHIPVKGHPAPPWWTDCQLDDHEGVDYLTNKFCTFTGDSVEIGGSQVYDSDPAPWLWDAYKAVTGETPPVDGIISGGSTTDTDTGEEWLTDEHVREALGHLSPDLPYPEWVKIGLAVHDYDPGSSGRRLFEEWSRQGSKYDGQAERIIDHLWNSADPGGGVTRATLVEYAKNEGWDASSAARKANGNGGEAATGESADDEAADTSALNKWNIAALAGLGEDGNISDLNDRQKAAYTWKLLKENDDYHVRVRRDNGTLWGYDSGIWKPEGERTLRHGARKALGPENYGANVLSELKEQARSDPAVEIEAGDLGLEPGFIAVKDGLVDLEKAANGEGIDAIRDLEPNDHALTRLPVEFNPEADYGEWDALVEEWAEEGRADALQEYVGYCLHVGAMPIHRALLLVGAGANGKGTFLHVVRALLGRENTASIELQTLANEKDAVADFYGALANIDDDLSARKLGAGLGMFKKLVAGDRVRARNLYESGFEFDATGKHLYAANEVPNVNVPDDDEAFWRRWLLIEFPNYYPPSQRDPTLRNRLTEPESLSGVLNWAIEGWARVLAQGHFTNEERLAFSKRERWQQWGESVDKFISECVEHDPDAPRRTTGEVWEHYKQWCHENALDDIKDQAPFTRRMKNENVGYKDSIRIDGSVVRGYDALGFTEDVPDIPDSENPDQQASLT